MIVKELSIKKREFYLLIFFTNTWMVNPFQTSLQLYYFHIICICIWVLLWKTLISFIRILWCRVLCMAYSGANILINIFIKMTNSSSIRQYVGIRRTEHQNITSQVYIIKGPWIGSVYQVFHSVSIFWLKRMEPDTD